VKWELEGLLLSACMSFSQLPLVTPYHAWASKFVAIVMYVPDGNFQHNPLYFGGIGR